MGPDGNLQGALGTDEEEISSPDVWRETEEVKGAGAAAVEGQEVGNGPAPAGW